MHMHKVKISIEVYRKAYNIPTKRKKEDGDG